MSTRFLAASLAVVACLAGPALGDLTFNFIPTAGMDQRAIDGFQQAANRWSALLTDNVTINVSIDFRNMGTGGVLGETSSERRNYTYSNYLSKVTADRTSAADFTAVSKLDAGTAFDMRINYTANNPNGAGSAIGYLDNDGDLNNTTIRATNANAKALGLRTGGNTGTDGSIEFNNNSIFKWDFDPSNGISAGFHDFVGVATHEIGHLLGFNSGVGTLDANAPDPVEGYYNDDWFQYVHPMDLFRYSTKSLELGEDIIDYTAGTEVKFFSIDGGVTNLGQFSTGTEHGDGRQTSHWKDHLGIGMMDPTVGSGTLVTISATDLLMFDVLGWNLRSVPEPSLTALSLVALPLLRRVRRGSASV